MWDVEVGVEFFVFLSVRVCVYVSVSVVDTSDSALRLTAQKFGGVRKLSRLYARY